MLHGGTQGARAPSSPAAPRGREAGDEGAHAQDEADAVPVAHGPVFEAGAEEGGRGDLHRRHEAAAHIEQGLALGPASSETPEPSNPWEKVQYP